MASDVQDKDFYNVFDGTKGRPEGSYLDIQERVTAEKVRALAENREPDLSEPGLLPAGVGTPLVPSERQVDNSVYSNPATQVIGEREVDPVVTLSVDFGESEQEVDYTQADLVADEGHDDTDDDTDDDEGI